MMDRNDPQIEAREEWAPAPTPMAMLVLRENSVNQRNRGTRNTARVKLWLEEADFEPVDLLVIVATHYDDACDGLIAKAVSFAKRVVLPCSLALELIGQQDEFLRWQVSEVLSAAVVSQRH